jgi:outer membrane receptor for ferrienterochelin and colicins
MNRVIILIALLTCSFFTDINAQTYTIKGTVTSEGEELPYVHVMLKGTNLGVVTDESGFYQMSGVPGGSHVVEAQAVGYKKESVPVQIDEQEEFVKFELMPDVMQLEQIVVTASRNEVNKNDAPVVVNTLTPENLNAGHSVSVVDGLNFLPGLRTENNCQNCGFTQLRMNGMEGAYSQILINGRPLFSSLAGVYGLEILPAGMIDRIEVIRGGGSALYGSNAVAGTVNILTRDPINNTYAVKINHMFTGVGIKGVDPAQDYMVNFNNSLVGNNAKNGMSLYGFYRKRSPFDANGDGFSELARIKNLTLGGRFYQRIGLKSKLTADLYVANENRRGGNKFNAPLHETDIAEAVDHTISSASLTFDRFFREVDKFSAFVSAQHVDRDSYYGANQALDAYGHTRDLTYITGVQYNAQIDRLMLISGIENQGGFLNDAKLAHRYFNEENNAWVHVPSTSIANQMTNTSGSFIQADYNWGKLKTSVGLRYDHYMIHDLDNESAQISGDVVIPRVNLLYALTESLELRLNYSEGYRTPQVYDEDLHVETSGARKIIHRNDENLKQEDSHSSMASVSWHPEFGKHHVEFLSEAFYTRLNDPFTNEFGEPDENGKVIYTRTNADGYAHVYGVNLELNWHYDDMVNLSSGFTFQNSEYSTEQEFGEKRFFRTPDNYGYFTAQIMPVENWKFTLTENYTGKMLIPYFGHEIVDPVAGELRTTPKFWDTGIKACYKMSFDKLDFHVFAGVKNIFNAYQDDFDTGINRDPAYIYGPMQPRTIYVGLKFGDF